MERKKLLLDLFSKSAKDDTLKEYHNRWLLPSTIVNIINSHFEMELKFSTEDFNSTMNLKNTNLLQAAGLYYIDSPDKYLNKSSIYRLFPTDGKKSSKTYIYYMH